MPRIRICEESDNAKNLDVSRVIICQNSGYVKSQKMSIDMIRQMLEHVESQIIISWNKRRVYSRRYTSVNKASGVIKQRDEGKNVYDLS